MPHECNLVKDLETFSFNGCKSKDGTSGRAIKKDFYSQISDMMRMLHGFLTHHDRDVDDGE